MILARRGAALAGLALLLAGAVIPRGALAATPAGEHVIGDPNAPVTIIEYASLSCSHCATFHRETLPKLKERYLDTGKVKLIFRDFPLEQNAFTAAMLARCAGPERQGRFIDVFFAQQDRWARAKDPAAALKQLARLGGMGEPEIEACLADKSVDDAVLRTAFEGRDKHGVRSTPTFVINGKSHPGALSIDEIAGIVDPLLR
jgi:protein-disulfide isomerase